MCLAIPGKIIEITDENARVDINGVITDVNISLIEDPQVGDYVMVHTGFAFQKYDEQEALENLKMLEEISRRADGLQ